jgi:hypothetical protein
MRGVFVVIYFVISEARELEKQEELTSVQRPNERPRKPKIVKKIYFLFECVSIIVSDLGSSAIGCFEGGVFHCGIFVPHRL